MSIFTRKVVDTTVVLASSLKQQSVNALDTFHRVMQDLKDINEQSTLQQAELAKEVARINQEISELETVNDNNTKVINNIEKILS